MRVLLIAVLGLLPLAGCLDDTADDPTASGAGDPARIRATLQVPDGAVIEETAEAVVAAFHDVAFPFEASFAVPGGATMVRFVADPGADATVGVSMSHADTGRRRCNQQPLLGFDTPLTGPRSCGSIAAIDPPGTTWEVAASSAAASGDVRIEFLHVPLDGVAAMLDLSQISHATYDLNPTRGRFIEAHDGAQLWVEVTLPQGDGPWPTVIAASPYNGQVERLTEEEGGGGTPAMWEYWTQDWAKRGYAALNIDVRGFGKSGGCVEVWGPNEQADQLTIVEWAAAQDWSDGNVGFYGQSYVGTTPVAAAVQAPEALKAIIAVAPVINAYDDWHFGGVPNGESSGSPAAYQALVDGAGAFWLADDPTHATDLVTLLSYATKGLCDPTLVPRANDPRAVYNEFYAERDFSLRAADVQAAVMYTEGFEDANVKSAMIPGWFNELPSKKLGIFGHWLHQHPARLDIEVLMLGWMDQYVKGKDLGFDALPSALVSVERDLHRVAEAWPPEDDREALLFADFGAGSLDGEEGAGTASVDLLPVAGLLSDLTGADLPPAPDTVTLRAELAADTPVVAPWLHLTGSLDGTNGFVEAALYEDRADGTTRMLTWGQLNLALRNGYDAYEPLMPSGGFEADLPFRPTEHMASAGSTLRLVITGVQAPVVGTAQPQPGVMHLDGGGTYLRLPVVELGEYGPMPRTAIP